MYFLKKIRLFPGRKDGADNMLIWPESFSLLSSFLSSVLQYIQLWNGRRIPNYQLPNALKTNLWLDPEARLGTQWGFDKQTSDSSLNALMHEL